VEVLNQVLIKRLGDGKTTSTWGSNWIPRTGMLKSLFPKEQNPPSQVGELIDHTTMTWRKEVVQRTSYKWIVKLSYRSH
jgi:hypothetical protein